MADDTQEPRGWDLSSTCSSNQTVGGAHGRKTALAETGAQALAQTISSQARAKFGADNHAGKALLDALAAARDVDRLNQLGESLLDASDWGAWLAGIEPPPPAANEFPEYFVEEEIDFEPEQPFIEMTAQFGSIAGKKFIMQCRLQKWYQPDLGEVLYEEATRIERQYKMPTMMAIVLLWPSADGPAVTGRYQATDKQGRKIDFRYEVKRAWEMPPEDALKSISTMMLIPLSKGAKERLPELIRLMKEQLAKIKPEPRVLGTLWTAFYWYLGMACTLEEAHTALGDVLPLIQATPDYKQAYASAFRKGYAQALNEGPILAIRDLVRHQAKRRFGDDPASLAALEAVGSLYDLKAIAARVPAATSWTDLLGSATSVG